MIDFLKDFVGYMRVRKIYWIAPVVVALLLVGILVFLCEGSMVAPFIYTIY